MKAFKSERFFPYVVSDLELVARDITFHFRDLKYDAAYQQTAADAWEVSISKGGMFRTVAGMKTALKIQIQPTGSGTLVRAGVGIFGQQAIPTLVTALLFWPVVIGQMWGIIRQASLDDEAIIVAGESLMAHAADAEISTVQEEAPVTEMPVAESTDGPEPVGRFCIECGARMPDEAHYCPGCGAAVLTPTA